jgi:hypothetical protein
MMNRRPRCGNGRAGLASRMMWHGKKPIVEAMDLHSVGAVRPERGAPPMHVTSDGVMTMFAFHVPVGQRLPTPPGLFEAEPSIVGRLVGA